MKKLLFFLILFCGIIAIGQSCKKNNYSTNPIETEDAQIEEVETDDILPDDNNNYITDAVTKMTAIGQNICTNEDDIENECPTFKYVGYSKVSSEEGDWGFNLTLSQTDTIDSIYTNKPLLVTTSSSFDMEEVFKSLISVQKYNQINV